MFHLPRIHIVAGALGIALAATACATHPAPPLQAGSQVSIEGTILSIDTQRWAYDGNAVIRVETPQHRRMAVQLPARWNLCKAPPVDVEALAVGMQVRAVGTAGAGDELVVCQEEAHRLAPSAESR